jgi:hypothetical protein
MDIYNIIYYKYEYVDKSNKKSLIWIFQYFYFL